MPNREHPLQRRLSTVRWVDRMTHPVDVSRSPPKPFQGWTVNLETVTMVAGMEIVYGSPPTRLNIKCPICKQ